MANSTNIMMLRWQPRSTHWKSGPPVPTNEDPLKYWHANKVAKHPLAQMALDFLSIPGMYV